VLRQLDISAPRVGEKCDRYRRVRQSPVRPIELLASRLKLLAEFLEVLHFESNVVQTTTFGSRRSGVRLREVHQQTWQLRDVSRRGRTGQPVRPGTECLHIPITCLSWRRRLEVETFHL